MRIKPPLKYKGKSKPKIYRKSRSFDKTCRNHGSCSYCERNRLYNRNKTEIESLDELRSYKEWD